MENEKMEQHFTYNNNRRCKFEDCGDPIPDQIHKSRKYCEHKKVNGKWISCKILQESIQKEKRNAPLKAIADFQKEMKEAIEKLLHNIGSKVSADHLNAQGIQLDRALLITKDSQKHAYYFLGYRIRKLSNIYWITKDDKF